MPETPLHHPPTDAELERGAGTVHSVFIKEITGTTYDHPSDASSARPGSFRLLPAENYIRSQLFNPCLMPQ